MDDELFLERINDIARDHRLRLPASREGEAPSAAFLGEWARFLEDCLKKGIALSDERWPRLTVASRSPHTVFALEPAASKAADPDFRVGLQLLMGLLEGREAKGRD
jgi:hypothetical protein